MGDPVSTPDFVRSSWAAERTPLVITGKVLRYSEGESAGEHEGRGTRMSDDLDLLVGLSVEELEALADGLLAPGAQARLSDLLARKREVGLAEGEQAELDRLLQKVDQLTLLKTRARYTLSQAKAEAAGT
jgi:hypothetical protein